MEGPVTTGGVVPVSSFLLQEDRIENTEATNTQNKIFLSIKNLLNWF
jgi:hypothetical protein